MASPEIIKHTITFNAERVFEIAQIPKEVEVGADRNFDGRVAYWADATRQRYGDIIVPTTTYKENGHRGSWIHHSGEDWQTGESFSTYHIVCDCAGAVEGNSPNDLIRQGAMCGEMRAILQKRAAFVDHTYHASEILAALREEDKGDFEQPNKFHNFGARTIATLLELDARHPAEWPGNLIQGQHQASILATMLQVHPEVVKWYGRMLEERGVIDFDGENMSLTRATLEELAISV